MNGNREVPPAERLLRQERERVFLKLTHLQETLRSNIDPDPEDGASELREYENVRILVQELENRLKSLDYALEQARQGKYGICQRCGNPIDPARLEAMPETTLCLSCKVIIETKR